MGIAKILITCGIILIVAGGIFYYIERIPGMGKLPGDILIKKDTFTFYFPLATSLLISLILSLMFYLWNKQ